ncbi:ABC transporter substrate-binding protein, partial [Mycobacterium bouchedurhonense]|uniref:ABC transporter substrate-binding protein n=1 Tax=Mycobacterium bouchedurhonense TaxID=701041 RepID=UPI00142DB570
VCVTGGGEGGSVGPPPPPRFFDPQLRGPTLPPSPPPVTQTGRRRGRRRRALILGALSLLAIVAVAAVLTVSLLGHRGAELPPYQAQSLDGKYGTVQLDHRPQSIAALGPGDPDAVLSLGVQPVAIGGLAGKPPSWLQDMVHSSPPVLAIPDPVAVAAAKPDLIIDTGDVDKATYDKLSAIAPTLTRTPDDSAQPWTWQTQLSWIAKALGRDATAKTLIDTASAQQTKIRSDHPAFTGKTITVVNYSDTAGTVAARESPPTSYLEGIGFAYNTHYDRNTGAPPDTPVDLTRNPAYLVTSTDVVIVARTDKDAGGGGFHGLPVIFSAYSGVLVIIDDPATITALQTGGPAATKFLNTTLVNTLADQIH